MGAGFRGASKVGLLVFGCDHDLISLDSSSTGYAGPAGPCMWSSSFPSEEAMVSGVL